jgi:hypothetical protein
MVATLLATLFASAALLAVGAMAYSWLTFGAGFAELRRQLRATHDPLTVRYTWRAIGARPSAVIYNFDFKAKADGLPFHPELKSELLAAA